MLGLKSTRQKMLESWLESLYNMPIQLEVVSGDASFRRYFRFSFQQINYIAVDAPPETENCLAFVQMSNELHNQEVRAPEVIHWHEQDGFMVVTDLGDSLLAEYLSPTTVSQWYQKAIDILPNIAQIEMRDGHSLPTYDEAMLLREMHIFDEWLLPYLSIALSDSEQLNLEAAYRVLAQSALAQPIVGVHRDFHSRNIMVIDDQQLAVIDFQDTVRGPLCYDLVSLLRDCYVKWPADIIDKLLLDAWQSSRQAGRIDQSVDFVQFTRWFDLMGIQRHLKASGIFARLAKRDGKFGYIDDIPRTLSYILEVGRSYPELAHLVNIVTKVQNTMSLRNNK